nr:unnamed protein product [Hydra vulgaris]
MLHPGYTLPNRTEIGGEILNRVYTEEIEKFNVLNGEIVAMSLDGWNNIHNEPIVCISVITNKINILVETINTSGHSHPGEYLTQLAREAIDFVRRKFGCTVKILKMLVDILICLIRALDGINGVLEAVYQINEAPVFAKNLVLAFQKCLQSFKIFKEQVFPILKDQLVNKKSILACHPHIGRLAIVINEDTIKVLTINKLDDSGILLKDKRVTEITCLSWRPKSSLSVAVGSKKGILVWFLDPSNTIIRPGSNTTKLLYVDDMTTEVSSVSWSPDGKLLACSCKGFTSIWIWDVVIERSTSIQRVGNGISYLHWSHCGNKLFAADQSKMFRVWETKTWSCEKWGDLNGTCTHGSVSDRTKSGRGRSVRTCENTEAVSRSIEENPTTSTQRRSQELGISRSSLQRIQRDLHMYPYKIQLVQSLQPPDFQKRLNYAVRFQRTARNDNEFIHKLIMGDEAHFHLNGHVNKQNMRFWGTENPHQGHASPLHSVKVTTWCGVTSEKVIVPFFFEDVNENAVTVTAEKYQDMLANFVQPQLANMADSLRVIIISYAKDFGVTPSQKICTSCRKTQHSKHHDTKEKSQQKKKKFMLTT